MKHHIPDARANRDGHGKIWVRYIDGGHANVFLVRGDPHECSKVAETTIGALRGGVRVFAGGIHRAHACAKEWQRGEGRPGW